MADAFAVPAANIITQTNMELRNVYFKQWSETEMLSYVNDCLNLIYDILVQSESELVRRGVGGLDTVANVAGYDLATFDMGDFWTPWRIWIDQEPVMSKLEEMPDVPSTVRVGGKPVSYYFVDNYIYFEPVPNATYRVNCAYFPNFVPLPDDQALMPFRNLFNLQVKQGVKILAKNRESENIGIEASLMQIFQDRALALSRMRRKKTYQMKPCYSLR